MTARTIHLVSIAAPFRAGVADMTRPPSALLYVGGHLKKSGFPVRVHHIQEHQIDDVIQSSLLGDDVLFVGFSVMTGKQVTLSAEMTRRLKDVNPGVPVVWGGIHPSLMPEECLTGGFADYVVIGEGEITAAELATRLAGDSRVELAAIQGIGYKTNGQVFITPRREFVRNLDEFRQDWSLVNIQQYVRMQGGEKSFFFISSRGCPHSCGFCYNQAFNARRWRAHSSDMVVSELVEIKRQTGIASVSFDDDNFFTSRKRALEIIRRLKEHGITCHWVELRVDYVTEELMAQLAELGVRSIFMGWESGSARTLERIAKGFSPQLILEKMAILARFPSLTVDASAIVGFPWETDHDIDDTILLALKMFRVKPFRLNFNIGIYVPYPGSPILAEAQARGFAFPDDDRKWADFDILEGTMELPWLPPEKVRKLTLIDKYAKLLLTLQKPWPLPLRMASVALAAVAYCRLRTRVLWFPVDVWLHSLVSRFYFGRWSRPAASHAVSVRKRENETPAMSQASQETTNS